MKNLLSSVIAATVLPLLATTTSAQNLVGYDGATGNVITFTGAPAGACAWPTGPVQSSFSTLPTVELCQLPGVPGPASTTDIGGVSVKLLSGRHFIAGLDLINGGSFLGFFEPDGTQIAGESLAVWGYSDITGMAYNVKGTTESMYFTDGTKVGKFGASIVCLGFPALDFTFSFTPFAGPGVLTGLDYDSATDTIWACTSVGDVIHFDLSGNQLSSFPSTLIGPHLTGIALDSATGELFLTDGTWVLQYDQSGATGPGSFWWPNVIEVTAGSLVGLDWVPAGVNFGSGADTGGGPAPHLATGGYSYMGNTSFSLEVSGGVPATGYGFYWSLGSLCPAIPVVGLPLQIAPPFQLAGLVVSDGFGGASLPFPLPPIASFVGVRVYSQAVGFPLSGNLQITEGLSLTLSGT